MVRTSRWLALLAFAVLLVPPAAPQPPAPWTAHRVPLDLPTGCKEFAFLGEVAYVLSTSSCTVSSATTVSLLEFDSDLGTLRAVPVAVPRGAANARLVAAAGDVYLFPPQSNQAFGPVPNILRFDPATQRLTELNQDFPGTATQTAGFFDGSRYIYILGSCLASCPFVRFDMLTLNANLLNLKMPDGVQVNGVHWDGTFAHIFSDEKPPRLFKWDPLAPIPPGPPVVLPPDPAAYPASWQRLMTRQAPTGETIAVRWSYNADLALESTAMAYDEASNSFSDFPSDLGGAVFLHAAQADAGFEWTQAGQLRCIGTAAACDLDPPDPVLDFTWSQGCAGQAILFTDRTDFLGGPVTPASWDFGDGTTAPNPHLLPPGTNNVTLSHPSHDGSQIYSLTKQMIVCTGEATAPGASASPSPSACTGNCTRERSQPGLPPASGAAPPGGTGPGSGPCAAGAVACSAAPGNPSLGAGCTGTACPSPSAGTLEGGGLRASGASVSLVQGVGMAVGAGAAIGALVVVGHLLTREKPAKRRR